MHVEADDRPDRLVIDTGKLRRVLESLEPLAWPEAAPADDGSVHVREEPGLVPSADLRFEYAARLRDEVRRLDPSTGPVTEHESGAWLLHGVQMHARDPLRRALELADACGATTLAEHVRTELHATGVRPRTSALSGVESLTASERRVASLAAEGGSNRDIAQMLFVTPKTVEVHLSNAYRKLGVRSRRDLASALGI